MPNSITLNPVESSQIAAIGHDPETSTLAIQFKSGGVYHYANVSAGDYKQLAGASSIGSYFYKHIKPNKEKFPYTKVS